ncbi:MAG: ferritin-like domain-containing protein [Terriglobales bacterium]|jgi:hypothetical protein
MNKENLSLALPPETAPSAPERVASPSKNNMQRRSFLKGMGMTGAALTGGSLLATASATAQQKGIVTSGDVALLRFAAAAELIEADLWQQYSELGGLTPGQLPVETAPFTPMNTYQAAFMNLDSDGPQYITSNALDEQSHAAFLNAYLISIGADPVDFDAFRTLPSSQAKGAQQIGRLTNIMNLTVDTSWYIRYRSDTNPDLGATYPQALDLVNLPGIPRTNDDFGPEKHVQAIANTAAFHFGMIEQTGTSLYPVLAQKATNAEVLKILISIGGDEIMHFLEWVDFSGNSVQPPLAPLTDPTNGLTFPNFDKTVNPLLQTNLIFGISAEFISPNLPACSVIRPTNPQGFAMVDVVEALTNSGHFIGQSAAFLSALNTLAQQADAAKRGF